MVQLNQAPADVDLATILLRVVQRLKQAQHDDPVDRSAIIMLARLRENGTLRLSDLAGHLCLDVSTVSRHVRTLEERGYVTRAVDPTDGRAVRLTLAGPGRAVLETAFRNRQEWLDRCLASWSADERQALGVQLEKLADALAQTDQ